MLVRYVVLVAIVAAIAGCDQFVNRFGVHLSEDGNINLLYNPCHPDALIHSVALLVDETDEVVWRIESKAGSTRRVFTIGESAAGFEAVVPLQHPLDPDISYRPEVELTEESGTRHLIFTISRLSNEGVFTGSTYESTMCGEEFFATDTCGDGDFFE